MKKTILVVAATLAVAYALPTYHIRQTAALSSGQSGIGRFVCGDSDHDSLPDFSFRQCADSGYVSTWQIWESRLWNRYVLVQSDTCIGRVGGIPPPGMHKGLLATQDMGDADGDGLSEILGANIRFFGDSASGQIDSLWSFLCIYESHSPDTYPDTLVWSYLYSREGWSPAAWYPGDMDRDGHREILFNDGFRTCIFENRGDNRYDLVFTTTPLFFVGADYAFGDFDQDSARDFAFMPIWSHYLYVYECTGDDQYALVDSVYSPYHNGSDDVFPGDDLDRDGKPEFFVVYNQLSPTSIFYVYMYEVTGNNTYEGKQIDSIIADGESGIRQSQCCDIDGDGIEELLISYNEGIAAYKAVGNDSFQRIWSWNNPTPGVRESQIQCYDMNRNGYQDIVVSGNGHTWMFEMEAIKVLAPNGRVSLDPGDTCQIRWRIFTPPRCDSVSLFLRTDSTWNLETIATGLTPTESCFAWVVPPGPVDSCRIVAIAYGPGWQYDESDTAFTILPGGVAEGLGSAPRSWSLSVRPTPAARWAVVRWDVPYRSGIHVGLYDAAGRMVRELASGDVGPGRYASDVRVSAMLPAGVYFCTLDNGVKRINRKVVLTGQ
jgi:hypothetical protein